MVFRIDLFMNMNLKQILIFFGLSFIQNSLIFLPGAISPFIIDILCTNLIDLFRKCVKTVFFTPDLFTEKAIFQIIINDIW